MIVFPCRYASCDSYDRSRDGKTGTDGMTMPRTGILSAAWKMPHSNVTVQSFCRLHITTQTVNECKFVTRYID